MTKLKALKKIEDFSQRASFTVKEAFARGVSGQSLAYYAKKGVIERIGPGIYSFPEQVDVDPKWSDLIAVVKSVPKATICLISALDIYGLTEEISRDYWIAIPHEMRAPQIKNCRFTRMRNVSLGRTKITIANETVFIFDKERTVIDTFRHLDKETAIKALKMLSKGQFDIKKLSTYAKKLRFKITPYLLMATT